HGVYIDITEQMAREAGLSVDQRGFAEELERAKELARRSRKQLVITAVTGDLPKTDDSPKYGSLTTTATVLGWVKDNTVVRPGQLTVGQDAALLLDRTNFYAEQGGQVGDTGMITTPTGQFEVDDTRKLGDTVLHIGRVLAGEVTVGQQAMLEVAGI